MSDLNQVQDQDVQDQEEDDVGINPEEIVRVIDLDDNDGKDYNSSDENEEDDDMDTEEAEAAAGPVQDDSIMTFAGHKSSPVICTRLSPTNPEIAVTGGQDDRAFIWSTRDGSVIFECTGHSDTVNSVGFSHDGALVASADMKGLIQVWRVEDGAKIWTFGTSDLEWIQWHQAAPVLLAGTQDGQVWMWKVPAGDLKTLVGFSSALCGKILPDGKHACVGYGDGSLKIWDLKSSQAVHTISGHEAHKDQVLCLDHNTAGSLILSGSADMTAKVTNTATGKVVTTFGCPQSQGSEEDSVEAVAFSKIHDYAVTGTLGGSLQTWDLPTKSVRHACQHPYGIVKIQWSHSDTTFFTSCLDGSVRRFDSRDGQLLGTWQGHTAGVLDFDVARNQSILVTASDDSLSKVFSLTTQGR